MNRKQLVRAKKLILVVSTGIAFSALSCVTAASDLFGTGLSLTGISGLLGPVGPAATGLGTGLDALADLLRLAN
ncbi:MAG: hypothetical protein H6819_12815 [Phycisphaerales bacterium]|nr:hypothetical protein [Phycisphaerales bacterium]MCB9858760.1 hypothetical protein [Phycisphaerales bacterium]